MRSALAVLLVAVGLLLSASCGSPFQPSTVRLQVTLGEALGWVDLMPGAGNPLIVFLPVTVVNHSDFDVTDLRVPKVQVIAAGRVIAETTPQFCAGDDCKQHADGVEGGELDVPRGARVTFIMNIHARGVPPEATWGGHGEPRGFHVRFRFAMETDGYRSQLYETADILIDYFPA